MDISGLGPRAIEKLYTSGHIRGLSDLYTLEERYREDDTNPNSESGGDKESALPALHILEGWGVTSAGKLFAAIERSRSTVTLQRLLGVGLFDRLLVTLLIHLNVSSLRFIFGLGIPHIGAFTAALLAEEFKNDSKTFVEFLHTLRDSPASEDEMRLLAVKGVGQSVLMALKALAGEV